MSDDKAPEKKESADEDAEGSGDRSDRKDTPSSAKGAARIDGEPSTKADVEDPEEEGDDEEDDEAEADEKVDAEDESVEPAGATRRSRRQPGASRDEAEAAVVLPAPQPKPNYAFLAVASLIFLAADL